MSLSEADKIVPEIGLANLVNGLAPSSVDRVIVMAPDYLHKLRDLLKDTSEETIHVYLMWKQIQAYWSFVEADAVLPLKQFSNELQGKVNQHPTWDVHY